MPEHFFLERKPWAMEWGGHFATRIKSPSVTLVLLPPLQMLGPTTGGREGARGRDFCGAGKSHVLPAAPQCSVRRAEVSLNPFGLGLPSQGAPGTP